MRTPSVEFILKLLQSLTILYKSIYLFNVKSLNDLYTYFNLGSCLVPND